VPAPSHCRSDPKKNLHHARTASAGFGQPPLGYVLVLLYSQPAPSIRLATSTAYSPSSRYIPPASSTATCESYPETATTSTKSQENIMATTATAPGTTMPCNGNMMMRDAATVNLEEDDSSLDNLSRRLRQEALEALREEPELAMLLHHTVLSPGVRTFEDAVACTITYRLLLKPCHMGGGAGASVSPPSSAAAAAANNNNPLMFSPNSLRVILADALQADQTAILEAGHTLSEAVRLDALAVCDRDPAVDTLLEVVLFLKGFAALVCHRAAFYKWHTARRKNKHRKSMTALWLQSQASAVFGVDIHPAATMGAGILIDHATGVVIGETATVGDGCTLLHGVTLGGTGKDTGDRHPKVGKDVLIGANASLLGNIPIGDGAKIGAGSVVLGPIPSGATAVGAPAKIIGRAKEAKPGSTMDENLHQVSHLHLVMRKSKSDNTIATMSSTTTGRTTEEEEGEEQQINRSHSDSDEEGTTGSSSDYDSQDGSPTHSADENGNLAKNEGAEKDLQQQSRSSKVSKTSSCCCPFRDYVKMARSAPKGTITLCTLRRLLHPEGCSIFDIGEILFALDTHNVGYVSPDVLFNDKGEALVAEKTRLPRDKVTTMMKKWQDQWPKEQALMQELKNSLSESNLADIAAAATSSSVTASA
jgi:serine O-acetyltransferase